MPQKVTTTDNTLLVYRDRDLSSSVIAQIPKDHELQLGRAEEFEGREWMKATLEDGSDGYVLGPSVRGHTTLGGTISLEEPPGEGIVDYIPGSGPGEVQSAVVPLTTAAKAGAFLIIAIVVGAVIVAVVAINRFGFISTISSYGALK